MRKRKNHTSLLDRALNALFQYRSLYILILLAILLTYPASVTDGMRAEKEIDVNVRLPLKYNTHGIDISHHNGDIDWQKVTSFQAHHSAVRFCFAKATEGSDMVDAEFQDNWEALKKGSIRRGAYHYFNPGTDPRLQALNFILNVKLEKGDLAPVLDWEELGRGRSRENVVANVKQWLEIIERHYDIKPIIYTNKAIFRKHIQEHFSEYPLWISHFEVKELKGIDLAQVYFWQHSMNGKVEGIETPVDFNVFIRDDFEIEQISL